jgi:hypothetical protein
MFKRYAVWVWVTVGLALWSISSPVGRVWGTPKVGVESLNVDLGTIKEGTVVESAIRIRNTGDEPLEIRKVQSSCRCATVEPPPPSSAKIAPGAMLALPVRYVAKGRAGRQAASIVVTTNDPERPAIVFEVSAYVEVLVVVRPSGGLFLGTVPRGWWVKKELVFSPGDKAKHIEVLEIRSADPVVTVVAERANMAGERSIRARLIVREDAPLGELSTFIEAKVWVGGEETTVRVPVKATIVGDMVVVPRAIVSTQIPFLQGGRIAEITVRSTGDDPPPDMLGVVAVGPIRGEMALNAGEDSHVITVYAADNAPAGPQSGILHVMTTSRDEPIVSVPVYFRAADVVATNPPSVVLSLAEEAPATKRVELRSLRSDTLTIEDIRFDPEAVQVEVVSPKQTDSDHPAAILIKADAGIAPAKLATVVVVKTDRPGAASLHIPVLVIPTPQ